MTAQITLPGTAYGDSTSSPWLDFNVAIRAGSDAVRAIGDAIELSEAQRAHQRSRDDLRKQRKQARGRRREVWRR